MATVIQFKRSSTQNALPGTGDLVLGEVAINSYHGRMYTEKNDGSAAISEIGSNPASLQINDAITFPTADGSSNQILQTNGSGTLAWADQPSSGIVIYKYVMTSTGTAVSGVDADSQTLVYLPGAEQVFLNGVKLVDGGADYTATSTTVVTLAESYLSGDVIEIVAITSQANLVQGFFTASALTTTAANQILSTNAVAIKAIKYVINATHASAGTHAAEVLLINNGSSAFFVQYGDVYSTASLFTLAADIDSGNMRLKITPANTNTTVDTFQIRHS